MDFKINKSAKFNIGQCVVHLQFGYRAIIIDADPIFQASGRINPQASRREFATRHPWYRLLVDGTNQTTYVEECHLKIDPSRQAIDNPNLSHYLIEHQGKYFPTRLRH